MQQAQSTSRFTGQALAGKVALITGASIGLVQVLAVPPMGRSFITGTALLVDGGVSICRT